MQSSHRPAPRAPQQIESPGTAEPGGQPPLARRWYDGIIGLFGSKTAQPKAAETNGNALLAFPSESVGRAEPGSTAKPGQRVAPKPARPSLKQRRAILIAAASVIVAALGVLAVLGIPSLQLTTAAPRPGTLTINTRPNDSEILIDGARRGTTPLTLSLTPGMHTITVRSGDDERVVPLNIAAGAEVSQYYEMKAGEPAVIVGRVSVVTDPPGARVTIDGKARGTSPITVPDLTPSEHKVTVTSDAGSAERTVTVTAGGTASVMFSLPKVSGPVAGWLSITAPFDVEIAEHDDVLGSSGTNRIMLAAGRHDITLTNRSLGYQDVRRVDVAGGKTMSIRIDPPKVAVSVNARPWAEVTLDGNNLGQTPIANLSVAVGSHDMVFRHPQFGERRQTVVVTVKGPNRITADLTK